VSSYYINVWNHIYKIIVHKNGEYWIDRV